MMEDAIRSFHTQFAWRPVVVRRASTSYLLSSASSYVVCGMGGSHLAADLLQSFDPSLDLVIWKNYGLPPLPDLKKRFIVLCSYSGNTEEVIASFHAARRKGLRFAVLTKGGELLRLAEKYSVPYVKLPDTGIQPRAATGFMTMGFLALLARDDLLRKAARLAKTLRPDSYERQGEALAKRLRGKVPVIYASGENWAIAEIWKIRLNETGKVPAFWNTIPEANHNEMTSFDVVTSTRSLSRNFHFVILHDPKDHRQNRARMKVIQRLYEQRGFGVDAITVPGEDRFLKVFAALLIGDWAALYLSEYYGTEAEQVPMVEEFKKLIA